jgi:hypothetical protein
MTSLFLWLQQAVQSALYASTSHRCSYKPSSQTHVTPFAHSLSPTPHDKPLPVSPTCSSAISSSLDLSLRTLEGDHIRPMAQALVDLPPEVARVANQAAATGGTLLGG